MFVFNVPAPGRELFQCLNTDHGKFSTICVNIKWLPLARFLFPTLGMGMREGEYYICLMLFLFLCIYIYILYVIFVSTISRPCVDPVWDKNTFINPIPNFLEMAQTNLSSPIRTTADHPLTWTQHTETRGFNTPTIQSVIVLTVKT